MYNYYQPLNLNPEIYTGQFILTKNCDLIPEGWDRYEKDHWFLGVLRLQVLVIENEVGQEIGWCVGYPLNHINPWAEKIVIRNQDSKSIDMEAVENFYEHTGGRYIIILLKNDEGKLFLDPCSSLGAVYSTKEQTVASTPTFFSKTHDWDNEIINALNMPESGRYFPLGLTPKKEVRRLLPNHYLDLNDWCVNRHWPISSSDLAVKDDSQECVATIISYLRRNIEIITKHHPIQLPLTAGRDSRMVLACAREFIQHATFFTFAEKKETLDTYIASRLSKRLNLDHAIIPFQNASEEEMIRWLYITGHCVSGVIWKMHKSLNELDPKRVLLNGIAAEVGKTFFWRHGDHEDTMLSAEEVLLRCGYPYHERFLCEMEHWLSELSGFNAFNILDLCYIEQRVGCWAAPQHYGSSIPIYEVTPFNQRKIIMSTMSLPYEYRRRKQLSIDICRDLWPELLELPFNEFIGLKNYVYKTKNYIKKTKRSSVNFTKKFVKRIVK